MARDNIARQEGRLAAELLIEPPSLNSLHLNLAGSVIPQVNTGARDVCDTFLIQQVGDFSDAERAALRSTLWAFLKTCRAALDVNSRAIGPEFIPFHKELEGGYHRLFRFMVPHLDLAPEERGRIGVQIGEVEVLGEGDDEKLRGSILSRSLSSTSVGNEGSMPRSILKKSKSRSGMGERQLTTDVFDAPSLRSNRTVDGEEVSSGDEGDLPLDGLAAKIMGAADKRKKLPRVMSDDSVSDSEGLKSPQ